MTDAITAALAALDAALAAIPDPFALVDKTAAVDVTDAIQKAIDAGIPIPAGRYLVDPVLGLHASRDVTMAPDAVLVARANSAPRYAVLTLGDGVTLTGGQIIGDRLGHTYTAGSTHEWGCGIMASGARFVIDGTRVSQCTGDGIEVSGDAGTIRNVVSTQNRRQGMSVFGLAPVLGPCLEVSNSEFSHTGALGADPGAPNGPCAGVDIEPDKGNAPGVAFDNCTFSDNQTAGLLLWTRAGTGSSIQAFANNCTFARNANGANAKSLSGQPVSLTINGGTFDHNRASAARIEAPATCTVTNAAVVGTAQKYAFQGTATTKATGVTYS